MLRDSPVNWDFAWKGKLPPPPAPVSHVFNSAAGWHICFAQISSGQRLTFRPETSALRELPSFSSGVHGQTFLYVLPSIEKMS